MIIVGFVLAVVPVYAPAPRQQQVVLICPKCHSHIPVNCKFCPECGADLRPKKQRRK